MNIFVVDSDPETAARSLLDEHVNKMILESVQILNTGLIIRGEKLDDQTIINSAFYRPTHKKHPCVKWVTRSRENFSWLIKHTYYLNDEYMKRFESNDPHLSWKKLASNWVSERSSSKLHIPVLKYLESDHLTIFPIATGNFEPESNDPVEAYREYYRSEKVTKDNMSYDRASSKPDWL